MRYTYKKGVGIVKPRKLSPRGAYRREIARKKAEAKKNAPTPESSKGLKGSSVDAIMSAKGLRRVVGAAKGGVMGAISKGINRVAKPFVDRAEKVTRYKRDRNTKLIKENFGSVKNYHKTLSPKKAKRY